MSESTRTRRLVFRTSVVSEWYTLVNCSADVEIISSNPICQCPQCYSSSPLVFPLSSRFDDDLKLHLSTCQSGIQQTWQSRINLLINDRFIGHCETGRRNIGKRKTVRTSGQLIMYVVHVLDDSLTIHFSLKCPRLWFKYLGLTVFAGLEL